MDVGIESYASPVQSVATPITPSNNPLASIDTESVRVSGPMRHVALRLRNSRLDRQSYRSHSSEIRKSGATIPKTYAPPSPAASAAEGATLDSAITPASTGAQHELAMPENMPSE